MNARSPRNAIEHGHASARRCGVLAAFFRGLRMEFVASSNATTSSRPAVADRFCRNRTAIARLRYRISQRMAAKP
jgi:hypothetical protein